MKKILLLILFPLTGFAQKANHWYFGVNGGIDFSSGTATAVYGGALNASGGTATISDSTGSLLFYTDGLSVWNRYHLLMPSGNATLGGGFGSQPVVIVPDPADTSQYYVFTTDAAGGPGGLRYGMVNMALHNDSGDVTFGGMQLVAPVDDKVAATRHSNGTDYWVVVHGFGNNSFYAYQVFQFGVFGPVVSNAGIVHDSSAIGNAFGQMKFNNCGNKLAVAAGYKDTVEVFDFDAATGIVSSPLTIPFTDHVYGIEFSPDASRLYVTDYNPDTSLVQFDLTQTTPAAVLASRIGIPTSSQVFSLQLGPDSNIYVARSFIQFVGVINEPDSLGLACLYNENGLDLDPLATGLVQGGLGLPGFMQSFLGTGPCNGVGIREVPHNEQFVTWQNPSSRQVKLHAGNSACTIRIMTMTGALVKECHAISDINISLEKGIYIVLAEKGKQVQAGKLIVVE